MAVPVIWKHTGESYFAKDRAHISWQSFGHFWAQSLIYVWFYKPCHTPLLQDWTQTPRGRARESGSLTKVVWFATFRHRNGWTVHVKNKFPMNHPAFSWKKVWRERGKVWGEHDISSFRACYLNQHVYAVRLLPLWITKSHFKRSLFLICVWSYQPCHKWMLQEWIWIIFQYFFENRKKACGIVIFFS